MSCQQLQLVSVVIILRGEPQEKAHMFVIDFVMYYFEITVEKSKRDSAKRTSNAGCDLSANVIHALRKIPRLLICMYQIKSDSEISICLKI